MSGSAITRGCAALPVALALLLGGCTATTGGGPASTAPATDGSSPAIPIRVARPEGTGPFPAIVILHDCSGLGPTSSGSPARWSAFLVERGYVALIPDSFSTRGHADGVCTNATPARNEVAPSRRVADAYAALAYARTLDYVDGTRIGVMGGSHGGSTTLATIVVAQSDTRERVREKRAGFTAALALYPGCGGRYGGWHGSGGRYEPVAPLAILTGELDDWTPAEPCRRLVESAPASGPPVTIKVYPGAHHAFDSRGPVRYVATRVNSSVPGGRGATTAGDPAAWADSRREVAAHFDRYLRQPY